MRQNSWKILTWVNVRSVLDQPSHRLHVPVCHGLGVGELLREAQRDSYLGGANVRVGRDDRAAGVVDALPHHVLSEKAFLFFQDLFDREWAVGLNLVESMNIDILRLTFQN